MEFIIEFILELVLEGTIEISKSKKVPKLIRYFLIAIITLLFLFIIALLVLLGIGILKDNLYGGIFFIFIGILLFILGIIKFKKVYLKKVEK